MPERSICTATVIRIIPISCSIPSYGAAVTQCDGGPKRSSSAIDSDAGSPVRRIVLTEAF
jgi:hypothetical protein